MKSSRQKAIETQELYLYTLRENAAEAHLSLAIISLGSKSVTVETWETSVVTMAPGP